MRQLVLFGGVGGRGNHGDTWSWDGTTWHLLSPATSPSARWGAVMASDPATGHVVLFGGADESSGRLLSDTWIWNGSTWSQAAPTTSPQARYFSAFALDPASGRAVLFGGLAVPGSFGDTWAWDGVNWTQLAPLTSPSARYQASMTFDPYTRNIVLFGGGGPSGYLGDTWTWTGTTWAREAPAASPPPRLGASMAYDPTAAALVLFGGRGGDGSLVADTWLWGPTNPPVTGTVSGSPTFAGGSWVISEARISGSVTVSSGANVLIVNSTINGSLNANGSGSISVCGTTVGGTASISGARGFVLLGDPGDDACAANRLHGVTLSSNHGGLEVSGGNQIAGSLSVTGTTGSGPYPGDDRAEIEGNNMSGSLSCSGNSPAATNHGNTNTVHGSRNGECVGF